MRLRQAVSNGHSEVMGRTLPWGCSDGTATSAGPCAGPRRSGPQRAAAARTKRRARTSAKTPTHVEWRKRFEKRQAWHEARNGRLCAAAKAVWKGTVENGNQGNKVEILHGLSIIFLQRTFQLQWRV